MKFVMTMILATTLFGQSAFASNVKKLGREANTALFYLSKCSSELAVATKDGAWIGEAERWDDELENFGYNYNIYRQTGFFETEKVGTLKLIAKMRATLPADADSHTYSCEFVAETSSECDDTPVCGILDNCPPGAMCIVGPTFRVFDNMCDLEDAGFKKIEFATCLSMGIE